ncbi:MAG TPA: hypothetical protein VG500_06970 [Gemmatimonadales bacterium]|jgi:hypothetical protein|nr:hypothetical protein [Gemmatimonadales bacterium]
MRHLFLLVAALGLAGIAFGVLDVLRGSGGMHGVPFTYENYGGPGSMLAGLMLLVGALYLRSVWRER